MARLLPYALGLLAFFAIAAPRGLSAYMALFSLLTLLCFFKQIDWRAAWHKQRLPLIAFALVALTALYSPSPRAFEMLRDAAIVAGSLSILFAARPFFTRELQEKLLHFFTATLLVAFAYYCRLFVTDFALIRWINRIPAAHDVMMTNLPKRPATLLLLLMWPAALYLWLHGRRTLATALLLAVSSALLLFVSRASMVGAWGGLALMALALAAPRAGRLVGTAFLTFILPLTLLLVSSLPWLAPLISPDLSESGALRFGIWQTALRLGHEVWPLGAGLDGSRAFIPAIPVHPHNAFLQIYLDLGLLGVALTGFFLAVLAQRIRHAAPAVQPLLWGAAASHILVASIAYGLWQGWWLAGHGTAIFLLALSAGKADKAACLPPNRQP